MVPENIHPPPTEVIGYSGEEEGGGVIGQIPSVGGGGGYGYFLEPHNPKPIILCTFKPKVRNNIVFYQRIKSNGRTNQICRFPVQ